jgi:hypothetical protein
MVSMHTLERKNDASDHRRNDLEESRLRDTDVMKVPMSPKSKIGPRTTVRGPDL